MAKPKIPAVLEPELFAKAAEGLSTRALAEWLGTRGVQVSHVSVARLLRETKEARADITAALTREALRPHVTSDLDRLEEIRKEMAEARRTKKKLSPADRATLARLEKDVIVTKLKFAGAGGKKGDGEQTGVRVFLPPEE